MDDLEILEKLLKDAEALTEGLSKKSILDRLSSEIEYKERDIIIKLGTEVYKKMKVIKEETK